MLEELLRDENDQTTTDTIMNRTRSHEIFTRAQQLMPGGVNSPARAFGAVGGEPAIIQRGAGAYIWDVDGNRYLDYIGSWGPMILGHAHPAVTVALEKAIGDGTSFGAPTEAENELAELIIEAVPSVWSGFDTLGHCIITLLAPFGPQPMTPSAQCK